MKLVTKISAAAVGLLLLFTQIFSLWLLFQTRETMAGNILEYEWSGLQRSAREFGKRISEKRDLDSEGKAYFAREQFLKCFSSNSVLYFGEDEVFNSTPYEFSLENSRNQDIKKPGFIKKNQAAEEFTYLEEAEGRKLLILYTDCEEFRIIHYKDMTELYHDMQRLFCRGAAGAVLLSALLLAGMQLFIRKLFRPLQELKKVSGDFRKGEYGGRIPVCGRDEIGEISQSFNQMAEQVEQHIRELGEENQKQNRLLGSLAHELKTPMTAIQGYAETLQRVKLSPEKQEKALAYIEQECKRLSRLSGKMLELTMLSGEPGDIERKRIRAGELLEEVRKRTACRLKEKELSLEINIREALLLWGDEDLLLSFFSNLVENACRASQRGGIIEITGNDRGIFVKDCGCGISREEIEKITEPFYMVDKSRSRKEGGAGLGLALCSQIARMHRGKLQISSSPEQGTCIGLVTEWLQQGEDSET